MSMSVEATPGAKMIYPIKRKPATSREELVMHWYANHMPSVIQSQHDAAAASQPHARRYIVLLFDANADGAHPWDGMAQLWWEKPLPRPDVPSGTTPRDTFQQKAEPYMPWATTEYVVIDGSDRLSTEPLTLNAPYPSTRSGFFRMSFFVKAKAGTDYGAFFDHWLNVHAPNVKATLEQAGGFRYVVNHSVAPDEETYAGLAELYFPDASGYERWRDIIKPDGMEKWMEPQGTLVLRGHTEMIGIP